MNELTIAALKKKNRKRNAILWFIPVCMFFTPCMILLFGWFGIILGPIIAALNVREKIYASMIADENVEDEIKFIEEQLKQPHK